MTLTLTVAHGNGHNERSLVEFARGTGADVVGLNEAARLRRALNQIPGYRLTHAGTGYTAVRDGARSTIIATSDEWPNIGELTRKVSEVLPKYHKIAPDRVLVASMFEHPLATELGFEGFGFFELHPDAGVGPIANPDHPLVREYTEALDSTRRHMLAARRDGLCLILAGDLQVGPRHKRAWGPRPQLALPLDLGVRVVPPDDRGPKTTPPIDWVLFDKALKPAGPMQRTRLYDHTGFVIPFCAR